MCTGVYLDFINKNARTMMKIHQLIHKILIINKMLTLIRGHNSVEKENEK